MVCSLVNFLRHFLFTIESKTLMYKKKSSGLLLRKWLIHFPKTKIIFLYTINWYNNYSKKTWLDTCSKRFTLYIIPELFYNVTLLHWIFWYGTNLNSTINTSKLFISFYHKISSLITFHAEILDWRDILSSRLKKIDALSCKQIIFLTLDDKIRESRENIFFVEMRIIERWIST